MTHPGAPRDIDLAGWLDSIGFKPANTEAKQLGHEVVRGLIGQLGHDLWRILPPGADKSHVFRVLRDALMWSNATLAVGGGPKESVTVEELHAMLRSQVVDIPDDPRIDAYKAEQRGQLPAPGDRPPLTPEKPFGRLKHSIGDEADTQSTFTLEVRPEARDALVRIDTANEGENVHDRAEQCVEDPDTLAEYGAAFFAAAARLREVQRLAVG